MKKSHDIQYTVYTCAWYSLFCVLAIMAVDLSVPVTRTLVFEFYDNFMEVKDGKVIGNCKTCKKEIKGQKE